MKSSSVVTPLSGVRRESVARALAMPDMILPFTSYRKKIPMHHIVRLEGEGNYTVIYFSDGTKLLISLTLKIMEGRLLPGVFARSHKKNIVNLLYLSELHPVAISQTNCHTLTVGV